MTPEKNSPVTDERWDDVVAHREELGKPMTPVAERRMLKRLQRLHDEGYDLDELIDRMINNGWLNVYKHDDAKRPRRHASHAPAVIAEPVVPIDRDKAREQIRKARKAI